MPSFDAKCIYVLKKKQLIGNISVYTREKRKFIPKIKCAINITTINNYQI